MSSAVRWGQEQSGQIIGQFLPGAAHPSEQSCCQQSVDGMDAGGAKKNGQEKGGGGRGEEEQG